jgi:CRISPR-associated protein Cas1
VRTLYIAQQGCTLSLKQEQVLIKQGHKVLDQVQLPLLEQILVFGKSQITTQVIRACLWRNISIAYLSRMGVCYGRILPIAQGYRQLVRYQQGLPTTSRLLAASVIVQAKLKNSRVLLLRHQRRHPSLLIQQAVQQLDYLSGQVAQADTLDRLRGLEGAGAASYYSGFADCIDPDDFVFTARSRRPPSNPINAMLSFGYQLLWNHLLSLIELQGLDPYFGCLHEGNHQHAALASDLIEEFRAPIIDSLVLYLVNRSLLDAERDFEFRDGGCFLNESGRKRFLRSFVQRMEEPLGTDNQPRWHLLMRQVKAYKQFVYQPSQPYAPYLIR